MSFIREKLTKEWNYRSDSGNFERTWSIYYLELCGFKDKENIKINWSERI